MLHPEPTQRAVLCWPIRWIAGLLLSLIVATGAVPANAFEADDVGLDVGPGALFASDHDERSIPGGIDAATAGLLGAKSGSDAEVEIEEQDADPPAWWAPSVVPPIRTQDRGPSHDAACVRALVAQAPHSTRAPPFA